MSSKGQCELFKSDTSCEDLKKHLEKTGYLYVHFFLKGLHFAAQWEGVCIGGFK